MNSPFPDNVVALFSGREVNFPLRDDNRPEFTDEQKRYLACRSIPFGSIVNIRQVHGNRILTVSEKDSGKVAQEADGAVTSVPGVVLAVRTADCVPVFLYDPVKKCIALVHAGWKGSRQQVVVQAVKVMQQQYGSLVQDLMAVCGPGIRPCCYEVGDEFKRFFAGETRTRRGHLYLDLALVNKNQLVKLGVDPAKITVSNECTCCGPDFFSYRREKEKAGRHLSLMMLKP